MLRGFMSVPAFGLGTFRLKSNIVISSIKNALELGYRAIDTAQIYDNEADVGQAIKRVLYHVKISILRQKYGQKI